MQPFMESVRRVCRGPWGRAAFWGSVVVAAAGACGRAGLAGQLDFEVVDDLRDGGEVSVVGVHAAGACSDFQQDFRQIDTRHAGLDLVAQRDQRNRFFQRLQGAEHQFGLVADCLEAHRVVLGQACGDAA